MTEKLIKIVADQLVVPHLFVNQMDKLFTDGSTDDVNAQLFGVVEQFKALQNALNANDVTFGSALHGWAFSIPQFAKIC